MIGAGVTDSQVKSRSECSHCSRRFGTLLEKRVFIVQVTPKNKIKISDLNYLLTSDNAYFYIFIERNCQTIRK